ncbi:MAG: hypothetical protein BWK79_00420 [Beggiatoa sp. IS2]|nr:MAG: hypothetical protein BWK79_00420 [Beggiatoa sp. IS2]
MNWQEVCGNPHLRNLPFKIELNRWGQVVMTPTNISHSVLQGEIILKMMESSGGQVLVECPIKTLDNVKIVDIGWVSIKRYRLIKHEQVYSVAPEICVEVVSAGQEELLTKMKLYFKAGAKEVWYCDEDGNVSFYTLQGECTYSKLIPEFPDYIEV